jgi:enoyl-CoA hydratase
VTAETEGGIGADAVGTDDVLVQHDADAIRVYLRRPPVNAFTVEMLHSLEAIVAGVRDEDRPLIVTGSLSVFSAGFDVKHPAPDPVTVTAVARRCVAALQAHPGLTIAAVEGAAVGLGLLIAMSADVLVVSKAARLQMPEVRLGITADAQPLRRFLPDAWVRRMCVLGESFTAEQLHLESAGVVVSEPGESLRCAGDLIAPIDDNSAPVIRAVKLRLTEPGIGSPQIFQH